MDENLKRYPEWKQFYHIAKDWEYGSFHSHEECAKIIGIAIGTKYYQQIQKANDLLRVEKNKHLKTCQKKGYEVILPKNHVTESSSRIRKTLKHFKKGMEIAVHTNTEALTEDENRKLGDYLQRAGQFKSLCETNVRKLSKIAGGEINVDVPRLSEGNEKPIEESHDVDEGF